MSGNNVMTVQRLREILEGVPGHYKVVLDPFVAKPCVRGDDLDAFGPRRFCLPCYCETESDPREVTLIG